MYTYIIISMYINLIPFCQLFLLYPSKTSSFLLVSPQRHTSYYIIFLGWRELQETKRFFSLAFYPRWDSHESLKGYYRFPESLCLYTLTEQFLVQAYFDSSVFSVLCEFWMRMKHEPKFLWQSYFWMFVIFWSFRCSLNTNKIKIIVWRIDIW